MRIFDMQGIKNSYKFMLGSNEDSGNFTGELSEVGEKQKLTVIWLIFRLQDNLLGNLEKLNGFRWGLRV